MSARVWLYVALVMLAAMAASAAAGAPVASGAGVSSQELEQGFVPLFNGRDLSGWQAMGAETWAAQDGELVCKGGEGGWLRSDKQYRDFILRLEYKISPDGNSGIFVRSTLEGDPAFTGMEIQVLDDYGDKPDKHSAGAVYDAVAPAVNASRPAGEWNQVEITCWGDKLTTYMNGDKLYEVNLADPELNAQQAEERKFPNRAQIGYIGLQNHGSPVAFRNLRISEGFVPIFNGRDLEGWKTVKPNDTSWSVRDGALVCSGQEGGYIYSVKRYGDLALRLEYKISPRGNSGVFLRVGDVNDFPGSGAEVQVLDSYGREPTTQDAGAIYDLVAPTKNAARPAEEWNQLEVALGSGRLTVVMNGEKVIDVGLDEYDKLRSLPPAGHIGLQNHHSPVAYRDIRVKTPSWQPPTGGVQ
jgi:hypothetical protein